MRVRGITIPDNKQVQYGLTVVYGVGLASAKELLAELNVEPTKKVEALTSAEEQAIRDGLEKKILEGDLRRQKASSIKRLRDIGSYRGSRHAKGLPARGQTTKNNSRTVRGNRRQTMGSGRVKTSKT